MHDAVSLIRKLTLNQGAGSCQHSTGSFAGKLCFTQRPYRSSFLTEHVQTDVDSTRFPVLHPTFRRFVGIDFRLHRLSAGIPILLRHWSMDRVGDGVRKVVVLLVVQVQVLERGLAGAGLGQAVALLEADGVFVGRRDRRLRRRSATKRCKRRKKTERNRYRHSSEVARFRQRSAAVD